MWPVSSSSFTAGPTPAMMRSISARRLDHRSHVMMIDELEAYPFTSSAKRVMRGISAHSASVMTGRVESGADFVPWTVRVHSQVARHFGAGVLSQVDIGARRPIRLPRRARSGRSSTSRITRPYGQLASRSGAVVGKLVAVLHPSMPIAGLRSDTVRAGYSPPISACRRSTNNRIGAETDHLLCLPVWPRSGARHLGPDFLAAPLRAERD